MFGLVLAVAVALQSPQSDAYLDPRARELVEVARLRRDVVDRSISRYQVTAKERMSMGLRTRFRDRLFYRRETASRIDWTRGGPIRIAVLGAREVLPAASPKVQIPGDLEGFLPRLAFNPMDPDALLQIDSTGLRHPLAAGSEQYYQFRTGDSTTINLGDRAIRLIELQVVPRTRDIRLISGSFWIDADNHSLVQVVFRLAKGFDIEEDITDPEEKKEMGQIPGFFKPIRAELQYVTIEYGLVQLRWWLPRLIAGEGVFQMGGIRTPLHYERSYSDYTVEGDAVPALLSKARLAAMADSLPPAERPCRPNTEMNLSLNVGNEKPDSGTVRRRRETAAERRRESEENLAIELAKDTARARRHAEAEACSKRYVVTVADSATLLNSPELPRSIFQEGEVLTSDAELSKLAQQLEDLAEPPWQLAAPKLQWALRGPGLARYNKVEALSLGIRSEWDLGRVTVDAMGRLGVADLEPNGEIGMIRASESKWMRLAAYRRLDVMDATSGFGGITNSLGALLMGRDERDYFRTLGAELKFQPPEAKPQWYTLRLYGETQRAARVETDFSLAHLIDNGEVFSPNLQAQRADQFGGELTLRGTRGQNPLGLRAAAAMSVKAETGDFGFVRPSLTGQLTFPLPFKLTGGLEAAAGTSTGDMPLQSMWFVGGYRTVRGYDIASGLGNAFWRGRAELGTQLPLARIVVFGDAAWAGDRAHFNRNPSLLSAGVGASLLDGLLRMDIARALRGSKSWKVHFSVDGLF